MTIKEFYDQATGTLSYIVFDPHSKDAVVIDPVLDFDPASGQIQHQSALKIIHFLQNMELNPHLILETHIHADHLSASQVIKSAYPEIKIAVGDKVCEVQKVFKEILDLKKLKTDGSQFDILIAPNSRTKAGTLEFLSIPTPGHTPACMSHLFEDKLFVGDVIFMPDSGTGRCDFPGGSVQALYSSIVEGIYLLPDETKIFVGHDYQPGGRVLMFESTVGQEKANNIHLPAGRGREDFVNFRSERDKTLGAPRLLYASLQVNLEAGVLPPTDSQGRSFLKIPITTA